MEIIFNTHSKKLTTKEIEGVKYYSLKDIENLWKQAKPEGASNKLLQEWKNSPETLELVELQEITVSSKQGATTWGCKDAVIEYASHCSIPFRAAVRKCFIAASEGDILKAGVIATSFSITPELTQKDKDSEQRLNSAIKKVYAPNDKYRYKHYADMANRVATGYCAKELTDGRCSATKYIAIQDHGPAMLARVEARNFICRFLEYKLKHPDTSLEIDYNYIKEMVELAV